MIVLGISATFLFPFLSWAFEPNNYPAGSQDVLLQNKLVTIPGHLGTVTHAYQGANQLVVYIQDLHCNQEVQLNIAKIIGHLAQKYQLNLVAVEGAAGTVDVGKLSSFPVAAVKAEVGKYFMGQGKISGAEFYAATGKQPVKLEGIEAAEDYEASRVLVKKFLTDESQGFVFDLREALMACKPRVYSRALLAHDKHRQRLMSHDGSLLDYAVFLYKSAQRAKLAMAMYPQLSTYVSKRQLVFPLDVDSDALYAEMERMEARLREQLYQNEIEQELDALLRRLEIIEKLVNISVAPEELDEYRNHAELFQIQHFWEFIRKHNPDADPTLGAESLQLNSHLSNAEAFYRLADQRSKTFVAKSMEQMRRHKTPLAVLISGGYHSPVVREQLRQQGISYLCVRPRLSHVDVVNPYFALLRERRTPLEKLLAQNQDILSLPTNFRVAGQVAGETAKLFANTLDVSLKDTDIVYVIRQGLRELQAILKQHNLDVAGYPENNRQIAIDDQLAAANPQQSSYVIPFKNLGITLMVAPRGRIHLERSLAVKACFADYDVALVNNPTQAECQAMLGKGEVVRGEALLQYLNAGPLAALVLGLCIAVQPQDSLRQALQTRLKNFGGRLLQPARIVMRGVRFLISTGVAQLRARIQAMMGWARQQFAALHPSRPAEQPTGMPNADFGSVQLVGAMSAGHGAVFRAIQRLFSMRAKQQGAASLFAQMVSAQTPGDQLAVQNALQRLQAAGISPEQAQRLQSRMWLLDIAERHLNKSGDEIGAVIAVCGGQFNVLFPRHRMQNPTPDILGDLLHEVVEVELLEAGVQGAEAHWLALQVRQAYVNEGEAAASALLAAIRDPHRLGKFEVEFNAILQDILAGYPEDLSRLSEADYAQIRADFLERLRNLGWLAPPEVQKRFENMLNLFINPHQASLFQGDRGHWDAADLILCVQRLHTLATHMEEYGIVEENLPRQNLTTLIREMPFSGALQLQLLEEYGLAGDAWDALEPDAQTLSLLRSGRFKEVVQQVFQTPRELKNALPSIKAIAVFLNIDVAKMENNFIINLLLLNQQQLGVLAEKMAPSQRKAMALQLAKHFVAALEYAMTVADRIQEEGVHVQRFVGQGFDGLVLQAEYQGRKVAVKINLPKAGRDPAAMSRMLEQVTQTTDQVMFFSKNMGLMLVPVQGRPVLVEVNEFIEGQNLRALVDRPDVFGVQMENTLMYLLQFLNLHQILWSRGFVNRDAQNFKNLIVQPNGLLRFIDFGNISPRQNADPDVAKKQMLMAAIQMLTGQHLVLSAETTTEDVMQIEWFVDAFAKRFGKQNREIGLKIARAIESAWENEAVTIDHLILTLTDLITEAGISVLPLAGIVGAMEGKRGEAQPAQRPMSWWQRPFAAITRAAQQSPRLGGVFKRLTQPLLLSALITAAIAVPAVLGILGFLPGLGALAMAAGALILISPLILFSAQNLPGQLPAMSLVNSLISGAVYATLVGLTGIWFLPILVAAIAGLQMGLIFSIWRRFNQAQSPEAKQSFRAWLNATRGGQVADLESMGIREEYNRFALNFARDWFRLHERAESWLPFRFIPVVGGLLNHLVASITDPLSGLIAALMLGRDVLRAKRRMLANISQDSERMSMEAAQYLTERINRVIAEKGRVVLGLPAGKTPERMFELLQKFPDQYPIDWSKVVTFNTSEFAGLSADDPQSQQSSMRRMFLEQVGILPENIHFLNGMAEDLNEEAMRYERVIKAQGGIDIQLLGIGENGHIGFNEPSTSAFASRTGVMTLTRATRQAYAREFGVPEAVPERALSIGIGTILEAQEIILLAAGDNKSQALAEALEGPITWRMPASALRLHRHTRVFLDYAAASKLSAERRRITPIRKATGQVSRAIRTADIRTLRTRHITFLHNPLQLLSTLVIFSFLAFGLHPLVFAVMMVVIMFFMPNTPVMRQAFIKSLRHEIAWPSRWLATTAVIFGSILFGFAAGFLILSVFFSVTVMSPILLVVGLVAVIPYLIWGVYHLRNVKTIITLGGPALQAKQNIAMALAENRGYTYVDTAVMFRALAYKLIRQGLKPGTPEALECMRNTKLEFEFDLSMGRQRVYMDGQEITQDIVSWDELRVDDRLRQIVGLAGVLGRDAEVEAHIKSRILKMARYNNLVVVGQNMGRVLDRYAKIKFYVTGDLQARAEQLRRSPLPSNLSDEEYIEKVRELSPEELAERKRTLAPMRPSGEAIVVDSMRLSPGDSIARVQAVVDEKSSIFFPIRSWWKRTFRPTHRMFEWAEGEILERQFMESEGDAWVASSDVDNLSFLNLMYGKGIVNHILRDIQEGRLEGINLPSVRHLTKGAINIRKGGDEASVILNGNLLPALVKQALTEMANHVQNSMHQRYMLLEIERFSTRGKQLERLRAIAKQICLEYQDEKMLRIEHDDIYGTRLLLRVDKPGVTPQQLMDEIQRRMTQEEIQGTVRRYQIQRHIPAKYRPMLERRDLAYLKEGYIWTPSISVGATKASFSLDPERAQILQTKWSQGKLTQAEIAEWLQETYRRAGKFLHAAKRTPGKATVKVDGLDKPEEYAAHTGESVLDPELDDRIQLEKMLFDDNALLTDEAGRLLFDGLVPWALSSAGLREYVSERLKALSVRENFTPEIFIARAPPSQGPDKVQIVIISPQRTVMLEMEGRYFGDQMVHITRKSLERQIRAEAAKLPPNERPSEVQIRARAQSEHARYRLVAEANKIVYKFAILNNLMSYRAGDEMIQAPQFIANQYSLQSQFLKNLQAGLLDDTMQDFAKRIQYDRNLAGAIKDFANSIENNLERYQNQVRISPTVVYSSVSTARARERGLGQLFQEVYLTSLARVGRITPYSSNLLGRARAQVRRNIRDRAALVMEDVMKKADVPIGASRGTPAIPTQSLNLIGALAAWGVALGMVMVAWASPLFLLVAVPGLVYESAKVMKVVSLLRQQGQGQSWWRLLFMSVGAYDPQRSAMVDPQNPSRILEYAHWLVMAHDHYAHRTAQILLLRVGIDIRKFRPGPWWHPRTWAYVVFNLFICDVLAHGLDLLTAPWALAKKAQWDPAWGRVFKTIARPSIYLPLTFFALAIPAFFIAANIAVALPLILGGWALWLLLPIWIYALTVQPLAAFWRKMVKFEKLKQNGDLDTVMENHLPRLMKTVVAGQTAKAVQFQPIIVALKKIDVPSKAIRSFIEFVQGKPLTIEMQEGLRVINAALFSYGYYLDWMPSSETIQTRLVRPCRIISLVQRNGSRGEALTFLHLKDVVQSVFAFPKPLYMGRYMTDIGMGAAYIDSLWEEAHLFHEQLQLKQEMFDEENLPARSPRVRELANQLFEREFGGKSVTSIFNELLRRQEEHELQHTLDHRYAIPQPLADIMAGGLTEFSAHGTQFITRIPRYNLIEFYSRACLEPGSALFLLGLLDLHEKGREGWQLRKVYSQEELERAFCTLAEYMLQGEDAVRDLQVKAQRMFKNVYADAYAQRRLGHKLPTLQPLNLIGAIASWVTSVGIFLLGLMCPYFSLAMVPSLAMDTGKLVSTIREYLRLPKSVRTWFTPTESYDVVSHLAQVRTWLGQAHEEYAHPWVQKIMDTILRWLRAPSLAEYAQAAEQGKKRVGNFILNRLIGERLAHSLDVLAAPVALVRFYKLPVGPSQLGLGLLGLIVVAGLFLALPVLPALVGSILAAGFVGLNMGLMARLSQKLTWQEWRAQRQQQQQAAEVQAEMAQVENILDSLRSVYEDFTVLDQALTRLASLSLQTESARQYLVKELDVMLKRRSGYMPAFIESNPRRFNIGYALEFIQASFQPAVKITPYENTTPTKFDALWQRLLQEAQTTLKGSEQDEVARFRQTLAELPQALAPITQDPRYPLMCGPCAQAIADHLNKQNLPAQICYGPGHYFVKTRVAGVTLFVDGTGFHASPTSRRIAPVVIPESDIQNRPQDVPDYLKQPYKIEKVFILPVQLDTAAAPIIQHVRHALELRQSRESGVLPAAARWPWLQKMYDRIEEFVAGDPQSAGKFRRIVGWLAGQVLAPLLVESGGVGLFSLGVNLIPTLVWGLPFALGPPFWIAFAVFQLAWHVLHLPRSGIPLTFGQVMRQIFSRPTLLVSGIAVLILVVVQIGFNPLGLPLALIVLADILGSHLVVGLFANQSRLDRSPRSFMDDRRQIQIAEYQKELTRLSGATLDPVVDEINGALSQVSVERRDEICATMLQLFAQNRAARTDMLTPLHQPTGLPQSLHNKLKVVEKEIRKIKRTVERQDLQRLNRWQRELFWDGIIMSMLYQYDPSFTFNHAWSVSNLMGDMAKDRGKRRAEQVRFRRGGFLHDAGKLLLPYAVLLKMGQLDDVDKAVLRTHAPMSDALLRAFGYSRRMLQAARHHEFISGRGYPRGLKGRAIPELTRAMTVADAFQAATGQRPYNDIKKPDVILAELRQNVASPDPDYDAVWVDALHRVWHSRSTPQQWALYGSGRPDRVHGLFSTSEIEELSYQFLSTDYQPLLRMPNHPLSPGTERPLIGNQLQAMLDVLNAPYNYPTLPIDVVDTLTLSEHRELFEAFIILHSLGKLEVQPEWQRTTAGMRLNYTNYTAKTLEMMRADLELGASLPNYELLKEIIRLHGEVLSLCDSVPTPAQFETFISGIDPAWDADSVLPLLIACSSLDTTSAQRQRMRHFIVAYQHYQARTRQHTAAGWAASLHAAWLEQVRETFYSVFPADVNLSGEVCEIFVRGIENGSISLSHLRAKFEFDLHAWIEPRSYTREEARAFASQGLIYTLMNTFPDRLTQEDTVAAQIINAIRQENPEDELFMLDMGVGSLPLTTLASANKLGAQDPKFRIAGLDQVVPHCVVTDPETHTQAIFDEAGNILSLVTDWTTELAQQQLSQWPMLAERFRQMRAELLRRAGNVQGFYQDAELGVVQPWQNPAYAQNHMTLIEADAQNFKLDQPADIIRASNIDLEYTPKTWHSIRQQIVENLREGGYYLESRSNPSGTRAVVAVFQKQNGALVRLHPQQLQQSGILTGQVQEVPVQALEWIDEIRPKLQKVMREIQEFYGPGVDTVYLLGDLGLADLWKLPGRQLIRIGIRDNVLPSETTLERWRKEFGVDVVLAEPGEISYNRSIPLKVHLFSTHGLSPFWAIFTKYCSRYARRTSVLLPVEGLPTRNVRRATPVARAAAEPRLRQFISHYESLLHQVNLSWRFGDTGRQGMLSALADEVMNDAAALDADMARVIRRLVQMLQTGSQPVQTAELLQQMETLKALLIPWGYVVDTRLLQLRGQWRIGMGAYRIVRTREYNPESSWPMHTLHIEPLANAYGETIIPGKALGADLQPWIGMDSPQVSEAGLKLDLSMGWQAWQSAWRELDIKTDVHTTMKLAAEISPVNLAALREQIFTFILPALRDAYDPAVTEEQDEFRYLAVQLIARDLQRLFPGDALRRLQDLAQELHVLDQQEAELRQQASDQQIPADTEQSLAVERSLARIQHQREMLHSAQRYRQVIQTLEHELALAYEFGNVAFKQSLLQEKHTVVPKLIEPAILHTMKASAAQLSLSPLFGMNLLQLVNQASGLQSDQAKAAETVLHEVGEIVATTTGPESQDKSVLALMRRALAADPVHIQAELQQRHQSSLGSMALSTQDVAEVRERETPPQVNSLGFWIARLLFPGDVVRQINWGNRGLDLENITFIILGVVFFGMVIFTAWTWMAALTALSTVLIAVSAGHQILKLLVMIRDEGGFRLRHIGQMIRGFAGQLFYFSPYLLMVLPLSPWLMPLSAGLAVLIHRGSDRTVFRELARVTSPVQATAPAAIQAQAQVQPVESAQGNQTIRQQLTPVQRGALALLQGILYLSDPQRAGQPGIRLPLDGTINLVRAALLLAMVPLLLWLSRTEGRPGSPSQDWNRALVQAQADETAAEFFIRYGGGDFLRPQVQVAPLSGPRWRRISGAFGRVQSNAEGQPVIQLPDRLFQSNGPFQQVMLRLILDYQLQCWSAQQRIQVNAVSAQGLLPSVARIIMAANPGLSMALMMQNDPSPLAAQLRVGTTTPAGRAYGEWARNPSAAEAQQWLDAITDVFTAQNDPQRQQQCLQTLSRLCRSLPALQGVRYGQLTATQEPLLVPGIMLAGKNRVRWRTWINRIRWLPAINIQPRFLHPRRPGRQIFDQAV